MGIMYIIVQLMGGILGAFIAKIVLKNNLCFEGIAQPVFTGQRNFTSLYFYNQSATNQTLIYDGFNSDDIGSKWFAATMSELMGTFFFVVIFLISTDKTTKFS